MKKTLLIIAVILIASSTAFSQVKFGVGVTGATKAGWKLENNVADFKLNFGANARVLWDFSEKFSFTGGFSYFLPSKITIAGTDFTYNYMVANADLMYYLMDDNGVKVYGLGGVNYAMVEFDIAGFNGNGDGLSWEAGAGIIFGNFYLEGKYDANMEQIVGYFGFYF